MIKYPAVYIYKKTEDSGQELRYSIRSLKNLLNWNGEIFIVGDTEPWLQNVTHIPVYKSSPIAYIDAEYKWLAAITNDLIPEKAIYMNDDFFITKPIELKNHHGGPLYGTTVGYHQMSKQKTAKYLKREINIDNPLDYSLHVPIVMEKSKRLQVHNLIKDDLGQVSLLARNVYGNLFIYDATYYEDKKTRNEKLPQGTFMSTLFYTPELNKLFPEQSEFEEKYPTVHMIWLGSELPEKYKSNIETYKQNGYRVKLWTAPIENMQHQKLYDAMNSWAGKADILRLEILYRHGGIYTDTDSKMISPLPITSDLVLMTSASGYIANETIYAKKGHPAIKEALDSLEMHLDSIIAKKMCNIWEICGATYLTPIFKKYVHTKLPFSDIGSHRQRPRIIQHSYDGSWVDTKPKSAVRPVSHWMDLKILKREA